MFGNYDTETHDFTLCVSVAKVSDDLLVILKLRRLDKAVLELSCDHSLLRVVCSLNNELSDSVLRVPHR